MAAHKYKVEAVFPNGDRKRKLVRAENPASAFDMMIAPFSKGKVSLTSVADKNKANVRVSLLDGSRQSVSYYVADFKGIKTTARRTTKFADTRPSGTHLICGIIHPEEDFTCYLVFGKKTTKEDIYRLIQHIHYDIYNGQPHYNAEESLAKFEELLPDDCVLVDKNVASYSVADEDFLRMC